MNWNAEDMNVFLQQKEYIDTAIIPLIKMEVAEGRMKASASGSDFLMNLSAYMEQQFKGRVMVTPPFSYSPSMDMQSFGSMLSNDLASSPFRYVFYLTTDAAWTSLEMKGKVLWLPAIPIEHMDDRLKQTIMEDQLKQLLPQLTAEWTD
ncbi:MULTISPECIES: YpiF family protein [Sporosarcina]|uniref:YpiF family protein n=1 Tax=Sporosarcina TaxID=1569 RepID=UPI00058AD655|nr:MULTISPECIES: YpiF family protein [Sporosarcina]WJY28585.1 YpiF family protein [Sporosarcina sp. 0.2-SM1T-5]